MFYDTSVDVKYYDIYKELSEKKKNENKQDNEEYSLEDILDICTKIYIDEYTSVFYAEDLFDDKIDIGMRNLLKLMKENKDFVSFLEGIHEELFGYDKDLDDDNNEKNNEDREYYVFLSLFTYDTFYLIHKVVCSQIQTFTICNDTDTLTELREIIANSIISNK